MATEKTILSSELEQLRAALMAERTKNEVMARLLQEKEAYIVGLHEQITALSAAASP